MSNEVKNIKKENNNCYTLLCVFKMRFNKWKNKIITRLTCEHKSYSEIYCADTHIFMYYQCNKCGKKKYM